MLYVILVHCIPTDLDIINLPVKPSGEAVETAFANEQIQRATASGAGERPRIGIDPNAIHIKVNKFARRIMSAHSSEAIPAANLYGLA